MNSRKRLITISQTGLNAAGGVPKWNRDIHSVFADTFECHHYCWDDLSRKPDVWTSEPDQAKILNTWLLWTRKVSADDIVIADGFWLSGLEHFKNAVSVAHGIWSHLTHERVEAARTLQMKLDIEFQENHHAQVAHRRKCQQLGTPIVAVSDFIADQMRLQWGFDSTVINNAVDLSMFTPLPIRDDVVLHGINDRSNKNKGWDHIEACRAACPWMRFMTLDEYSEEKMWTKEGSVGCAAAAVVPSGYEGNSYFMLELLASATPVVCYDVGLPYLAARSGHSDDLGVVLSLRERYPTTTAQGLQELLTKIVEKRDPRAWLTSVGATSEQFAASWRSLIEARLCR